MSEYLETTVDKFIFRVASNRLYSPEGVWAIAEGSRVRFGLTDYLQQLNGDVAFVHVKPVGTKLAAGDEFAELETIKATVSFFAPVRGAIVEGNADLDLSPEVVNQEPYGKGWLVVIEATDWAADRVKLLDPQAYLFAMRSQADEELKKQ
ncbi:MAG: glycine cleavage system protein H [Thermoguttaceae bacterium]|jgi:glycine cleavage system H protein